MTIATIKKTREIQETYGVGTRKSFGQNFIIEPRIVEKIADAAVEGPEDLVFEIGPGIGALTEQLCQRAKHVTAFEIDARLPEILEKEIGTENLEVVLQDILETDVAAEIEKRAAPGQKVRFVSNLPYYITTPILFKLFENADRIDSITVMMQKEVGDRFLGKVNEKEYNALSVITQYGFDVKKVMDVSRNVFVPKPNVDSVVLQFKRRQGKRVRDEDLFYAFVKGCFTQRRKTIYNNLQNCLRDKSAALQVLETSGIDPKTRAQQLRVEDFVRLYEDNYETIRECESQPGAGRTGDNA